MSGVQKSNRSTAEDRTQFRAFINDEESRQIVEQVLKELVIQHATIHRGGISAAIDFLSEHRSPKILIVDLSGIDLPLSAVNDLAEVCEPGVTVIALGDRNDVGLFRELINNGVSDYIVKPLTPALLQKSLLSSVDGDSRSRQTSKLGRLVCFVGARGGVGTTTLATSVAYHIAEVRRRRVAIVDLDLYFGSVALALDLEPSRGYREALEDAGRIDSLYVERALSKLSDTLYILSAEEKMEDIFDVDRDAMSLLLQELRSKFHYVILDLSPNFLRLHSNLIKDTSNSIIATDMSLAGMRDTVKISGFITGLNAACQIDIVANKCGEHKDGEIPKSEFEKGISRHLTRQIPFDNRAIAAATNLGKPVASVKSTILPSIECISEILCGGNSNKNSSKSFIGKILSRKGI